MTIKAAVFDLGGVVVDFSPTELTQAFTNDEVEAKLYLDTIRSPLWLELDRGTLTPEELASILEKEKGAPVERTMSFFKLIRETFKEIESTTLFIEALSKRGVEIYFLSNINIETFDFLSAKFDVFKHFKGGIKSAEVGLCKPEPAIFDLFLKETGLTPDEFVFFDDTMVNIEEAMDKGWNVFEYNKEIAEDTQEVFWDILDA